MAAIGDRIRQRRAALGMSQRNLATERVSFAYISRIEAGSREPSVKALRQIAPKLGVSVHWLETGEDDPAEELAQIVLEHRRALPARAATLARSILAAHRSG